MFVVLVGVGYSTPSLKFYQYLSGKDLVSSITIEATYLHLHLSYEREEPDMCQRLVSPSAIMSSVGM